MDEQARPNLRTNLRDLRLPVAATGAQALASQILRPTALVARLAARGEPLVAGNFGAPLIARYHQLEGAGQLALGVAERFATGASEPPGLDLGLAAAAPPSLEPAPTRGWPAPVASAVPTVARRADPLLGELAAQGWGQPRGAPPDAASSDAPGANTGIIAPPAPGDIRRSPVPAAPLIAAVSTMPTAPALIARAAVPVSAPPLVGTPPPAEPAPAQSTTDADAPAAFSGPPAQVAEDTSFSAVFDAGSTPSEVPAIRRAAVSDNASVGASDMAPTLQRSDAGQQQASSTAETAPAASGGALFTPQHATAPPDLVLRPTIARASAGQQAPLGASEPTPAAMAAMQRVATAHDPPPPPTIARVEASQLPLVTAEAPHAVSGNTPPAPQRVAAEPDLPLLRPTIARTTALVRPPPPNALARMGLAPPAASLAPLSLAQPTRSPEPPALLHRAPINAPQVAAQVVPAKGARLVPTPSALPAATFAPLPVVPHSTAKQLDAATGEEGIAAPMPVESITGVVARVADGSSAPPTDAAATPDAPAYNSPQGGARPWPLMLTSLLLQRYANDLDSALPMPLLRTRPAVPAAVQRTGDTPTTTPLVAQHSVGALAAQPASLARQEEKAAAPAALPESGQGAYAAPATSSVIRSAVIVALAPALHARRMGTPALQRMEAGLQVQPSASQPAAPIDWGALPLVQRSMAGSALVAQLGATSLVARSPALVPSVLAARTASQPAAATAIPALALPPASPDSPNDAVAAYGASDNDWADGTDAGFAPGASDGGWPYGPDADNLGKPQPPIARTSDAPPLDLAPRSAAPATPSDAPALPQWGGSAAQVPQQDSFVPITRTMPELELAQPTQANPQRTPADAPPDAPATQSAQGAQGAQGANQINIEVLAQKVYDHLRRRLQIDHERRGRTGSERGVR